jgi:coenzyme F420-reducing hydrogenase delta subunit
MPQWPIDALRRRLEKQLAAARGAPCFVVFGCDHGARLDALASRDTLTFSLACAGMLPPSFVEYALRGGADGVVISTCREGGCEFRLGERWTAQRLGGDREPHLRRAVPADRWTLIGADAGEEPAVRAALERLRRVTVVDSPPHRQEAIA